MLAGSPGRTLMCIKLGSDCRPRGGQAPPPRPTWRKPASPGGPAPFFQGGRRLGAFKTRGWDRCRHNCVVTSRTLITRAPRAQENCAFTASNASPDATISAVPEITHPWPGLRVPCTVFEATIS